ncbi:hypothetical protein [Mesorhizobium sp.]|nr:hypothetical protein [Mesorhizobium sp.]
MDTASRIVLPVLDRGDGSRPAGSRGTASSVFMPVLGGHYGG